MRTFLVLLFLAAVPCLADDQCPPKWNYSGTTAPEYWGGLNTDWIACSTGMHQSPIAPRAFDTLNNDLPLLDVTLTPSTFDVKNTSYTLEVSNLAPAWTINWGGRRATLKQFHFHRPAEHYDPVGKVRPDAEIHFVFKEDNADRYIVLAAWVMKGAANDALAKILAPNPVSCQAPKHSDQTIKITELLKNPNHYATYNGSLTTPPCTENVTFILTLESITASQDQLTALTILPLPRGNARPLQGMPWRQSP